MRIGARGSALALAQARLVADSLGDAEIVVIKTSGDEPALDGASGNDAARPPDNDVGGPTGGDSGRRPAGDKSRWVEGLERALLRNEIDLAVHSAKDVPGEIASGLALLGSPTRAPAEDVLIGAASLDELPEGARVGTSSLRRAAQLRAARPDLDVVRMRGNVDTRLRKLADRLGGEPAGGGQASRTDSPLHAIVLASAGLRRLGREHEIGGALDPERFVPAPGQGALALQARADDEAVREAVAPILDSDASACLTAERAVASALQASCDTPLGAYAAPAGRGCLLLRVWVGLPDGSEWLSDELLGGFYDPAELGRRVAERLEAVGVHELLARAQEMAVEHA